MQRKDYLLIYSGRGDRGGCPGGCGVVNGGLWWPEKALEVNGVYVAVAATVVLASPESLFGFLVCREHSRWL